MSEILNQWYPAILAFMIVSASINGLMTSIKATLKNFPFYESAWFVRLVPLFPNLLGMLIWPFVAPYVLPEGMTAPIPLSIMAGALAGSLSANVYAIWTQGIKGIDSRIQGEIANVGKEDGVEGDEPSEPSLIGETEDPLVLDDEDIPTEEPDSDGDGLDDPEDDA